MSLNPVAQFIDKFSCKRESSQHCALKGRYLNTYYAIKCLKHIWSRT